MSEMNTNNITDNDVNGAGTLCEGPTSGRCPVGEQRGPGRHPTTARMKWNKEVNRRVMECFYRSKPFNKEGKPIRGYRQRMFREWRQRGMFDSTEQRVCDQARAIRKNGWLSELELESIRKKIESESQVDTSDLEEDVVTNSSAVEENNVEDTEYLDNQDEGIVENENFETDNNVMNDESKEIVDMLKQIVREGKTSDGILFKKVDRKKLRILTTKVNSAISHIKTNNITQTNNLIKACSVWIAEKMGLKKFEPKEKIVTRWKRRIESEIKELKRNVCLLDRKAKNELGRLGPKKSRKLREMEEKYRVKRKGIKTVIEELKQRMIAKSEKIKRYDQRINQFRLNRMFNIDQKKVYMELSGGGMRQSETPDAEDSKKFWGNIWGIEKEHNKDADWMKEIKEELISERRSQDAITITHEMIKKQCSKIPNWKAPGKDKVQGYWIKNFTSRIAWQLNNILEGEDSLPEWMTYGHTVLCQKDTSKGNAVDNYRPITCLPLMWKLMTGVIAEEMYTYLESERLLPE